MLRTFALRRSLCFSGDSVNRLFCWPRTSHYTLQLARNSTKREVDFYAILGVQHTASVSEIKAAFRKRAKRSHPDALKAGNPIEHTFSELLAAYQVLTNARERQIYDLSRDPRTGKVISDTVSEPPTERNGEEVWVQGGGWAAWAASAPEVPRTGNEVDRIRAELRTELRLALRHAYLGPKVEVGPGQLPECFEGEERSDAGVGDLMHLVSGRQLLGIVREVKTDLLPGRTAQQYVFGSDHNHLLQELSLHGEDALGNAGVTGQNAVPPPVCEGVASSRPIQQVDLRKDHLGGSQPEQAHKAQHDARVLHRAGKQVPRPLERSVLVLEIGDKVIARGVRELFGHSRAAKSIISIYDVEGGLISREVDGKLEKATPKDASGGHQSSNADAIGGAWDRGRSHHAVLRGQTPFVRHIQFLGFQGGKRVSICRCRRAWLPHKSLWIFPPRSLDHSIGGWYFEWPGHDSDHPLWLPASVFVLTVAFGTLDEEKSRTRVKPVSTLRRAAFWAKQKLRI